MMRSQSLFLLVLFAAGLLTGCTRLGAQTRLEGRWQGVQDIGHDAEKPIPLFDPSLTFEMEFKSDHTLRANLPQVGVVFGTWRVTSERRGTLELILSYSGDGKSKYVEPMSVQFDREAEFVAQPPGAPGPVRFSRVK